MSYYAKVENIYYITQNKFFNIYLSKLVLILDYYCYIILKISLILLKQWYIYFLLINKIIKLSSGNYKNIGKWLSMILIGFFN